MNVRLFRGWLSGTGVLMLAHVIWFTALETGNYSEIAVTVLWLSPFVAALVSAYMAPRWKLVTGISMAPIASLLVVLSNFAYQWRGMAVDFPGEGGGLILFTVTLAYSMMLCGLGSIGGLALAKKFRAAPR